VNVFGYVVAQRVETERLLLRTWEATDADALGEIYRQPEYLETMPPADPVAQIAAFQRRWERLISITLPYNHRSRAVMERLGMTYRGGAVWRGYEQVWYALDREPEAE
jgi:RimJ/RimL family protein N-acetyltransferase